LTAPTRRDLAGTDRAARPDAGPPRPVALARASVAQMVAVGLAAALVFATVIALIEWRKWDSLNHAVVVRNQVAATASALGEALFTYDYRDLAAAQSRVLVLATGPFAAQEAAATKSVEANLAKVHATSTATLAEVSVTPVDGNRADAFVIVDSHATGTGGSTAGRQYLNITLERVGGRWKVDTVQGLIPPMG
jgi:hypothetical protein